MTDKVDENGRKVLTFTSKIVNLSKVGELTNATLDIVTSGAWRDYTTASGREIWRPAELDYFLIANNMRRDDAARVMAHNKQSKQLALLMDVNAGARRRRTLEQAAKDWHRLNINLVSRARELGWIPEDRSEITAADQPIDRWSQRTAALSKDGKKRHRWGIHWTDDRSTAEAIVDKLLTDEMLARDVYKKLHAKIMRDTRAQDKGRSTA